jgi:hypothetical protein
MAVQLVLLTCMALVVSGCETNAQRSASLEKLAHEQQRLHPVAVEKGVVVTRENAAVKVLEAMTVHGESGTAAVVTLKDVSKTPLSDAPIAIVVKGKGGAAIYENNAPGLEPSLVSVPLLQPGRRTVWIDDQVETTGTPTGASALVGQAPTLSGAVPQLSVEGVHGGENTGSGASEEGTVVNHSSVNEQQLVVYVVGRRAGRVVAAGRAVLPEVKAGASTPFQAFLIGSAQGAKLEVSAPPTTF